MLRSIIAFLKIWAVFGLNYFLYCAGVSLKFADAVTFFWHYYSFFVNGIKFRNENRHNYQKSNFHYDVIISEDRIFWILQLFSMLNFVTMIDGICPFCRFFYFNVSLHSKFIHWMDEIEYSNIFSNIDTIFVKISASV